jgi:hypothetical protein
MDIHLRLTPEDRDALTAALAASGENDAVYLTSGAVAVAVLTLAMPFTASNEGGLRLLVALILAYFAIKGVTRLINWWRIKRTRWFPLPSITGLEPGERRLTIALESVREVSELGERVYRWRAFEDATETEDWITLRVSDRECLVIPRSALKHRGLAESEALVALIGRGDQ